MTEQDLSKLDTAVTDLLGSQLFLVKIDNQTKEVISSEMVSNGYAAAVYENATGKTIQDMDGSTFRNKILVSIIEDDKVLECEFIQAGYSAAIQQHIEKHKTQEGMKNE